MGFHPILLIFPLIVFLFIAFVFQSSTPNTQRQEFLLNCPYPISNEVATFGNPAIIDGRRLNYSTVVQPVVNNYNGTFFECFLDPTANPQQSAFTRIKPYGATLFNVIPYGWYAWVGDTISVFFAKAQPLLTLFALVFTAPAQVTGITWFTYINIGLVIAPVIGIILLIRG